MAETAGEQPASCSRNPGVGQICDARYDALPPDRGELLARAVILVAGMAITEAARKAVLARVTAELVAATERPPEASVGAGEGTGD
jgi:hypothetical protein